MRANSNDGIFNMAQPIITFAKPPWVKNEHTGKLERLILQLGSGKGEFSEVEGIPRSIGCIGNNKFVLRDSPMEIKRMKEIVREFSLICGKDLYLTNYDDLSLLEEISCFSAMLPIENIYPVVRLEDFDRVNLPSNVKPIVEARYSSKNMKKLQNIEDAYAVLLMIKGSEIENLENLALPCKIYIDVLFPGSLKRVDFDLMKAKRAFKAHTKFHPCLCGTLAITRDGFALPCPLLRKFIVGNAKELSLRQILRKRRLKRFWKLTKKDIEGCKLCPFNSTCHDCRALEYYASGDIMGVEYCPLDHPLGYNVQKSFMDRKLKL
ncbi:SPASM domain-containing protein [Thermococcus aggregans]|uniref:SPASM domain-containing protein n=1 Tax=Thermococcus aggregans TaxID=110163 RepID=A0A9E7SP70_THEAG|nr:SPASM domain-containing protein [Thermococcus aggregans]USS41198.1 SPASM domain-containing protein [Thermococcus aggregans]